MSLPAPLSTVSFSNKDKPVDPDKCNAIYWQLIRMLEGSRRSELPDAPASSIIRELWQTQRCDKTGKDLASLRQDIVDYMGEANAKRVLEYTATDVDDIRALEAIAHYREHATGVMVSSLYLRSQLYYQTVHQVERTALLGGAAGLGRWMWKQNRALQAARQRGAAGKTLQPKDASD
jgi:hypothetical protein